MPAFSREAVFFKRFFFHDRSSSEVLCWVYGVRLGRNVGEILETKHFFLTKNTLHTQDLEKVAYDGIGYTNCIYVVGIDQTKGGKL